MAETVADIELKITQLKDALQELFLGKRLTTLVIGSADSTHRYTYQEITEGNLKAEIKRLEATLAELNVAAPTFRSYSHFPLRVNKSGV